MQPPSQKFRPISFYLSGGAGSSTRLDLPIRPEELTRQEPSRLTVVQTLGGAFADSFGAGVATLTLAGHCGWRGSYFIPGEDAFAALRSTVFQEWHARRSQAVTAGQDPSQVALFYADVLNNARYEVAPRSFVMRRSRSSPLLIRYQIVLAILDDGSSEFGIIDTIVGALSNPLRWLAGVTGMTNTLVQLDGYLRQGLTMLGAARTAAVTVLGTGLSLLNTVKDTAEAVRGIFDGPDAAVLDMARRYSLAAKNAFAALAAEPSLNSQGRAQLMGVAGGFTDAYCTMENSFNIGRYFKSYDDLFGASNCSSTAGGRAWSTYVEQGLNPFVSMFPAQSSPVSATQEARSAMTTLAADPLRLVGDEPAVARLLSAVGDGVRVAA